MVIMGVKGTVMTPVMKGGKRGRRLRKRRGACQRENSCPSQQNRQNVEKTARYNELVTC